MRALLAALAASALVASPAFASHRSHGGGHYAGGSGSSHKGGHYRNAATGNHYRHRR